MSIDFVMHDGRDRIEEGEFIFSSQTLDGARERGRGEGARRHDDAVPFGRRKTVDLPAHNLDQRMILERLRHRRGEAVSIDRERAACR